VANAHGNGNNVLDVPDISTQTFRTVDSTQETDTDQFNLSLGWDNEQGVSVKFGVGLMSTKMHAFHAETQDFLGGWGVGFDNTPGCELGCQSDIADPSLVTQVNTIGEFNDLNFDGYPDTGEFPATGYYMTTLGAESFVVDPWSFAQAMEGTPVYPNWSTANLTPAAYDNNTIEEDIYSAYAQAKFDGEIAGMETQTVVGLRYERTKVDANAQQNIRDYFTWQSDNDFFATFLPDLQTQQADTDYGNFLPNIDFSVALNDQMKVRASVSQTIARPAYNQMFMTMNVNSPSTPTFLGGRPTASRGNPALDPLESTNLDLSFEYYYGEASYASIGFFAKTVNNFVGNNVTATNLPPEFQMGDMTSGAPGTLSGQAAAELALRGYAVNEQNLFTMSAVLMDPVTYPGGADDYIDPTDPDEDGAAFALLIIGDYEINAAPCTPFVAGDGQLVSCGTVADPLMTFFLSEPVNTETANINGFELAWQHFFGDSGFGFQANATLVNGDVGYNLSAPPAQSQFALEGLSDSANAVLIYEKFGLSARLAYNWRDAFLTATTWAGQQGLPGFVDEYTQLDLNITYNVNDQLAFGLDGINMTGEGQIIYSRTKQMQFWNAEGDPRWILTARYNFN
jgi:TonB-dependent receptor